MSTLKCMLTSSMGPRESKFMVMPTLIASPPNRGRRVLSYLKKKNNILYVGGKYTICRKMTIKKTFKNLHHWQNHQEVSAKKQKPKIDKFIILWPISEMIQNWPKGIKFEKWSKLRGPKRFKCDQNCPKLNQNDRKCPELTKIDYINYNIN